MSEGGEGGIFFPGVGGIKKGWVEIQTPSSTPPTSRTFAS